MPIYQENNTREWIILNFIFPSNYGKFKYIDKFNVACLPFIQTNKSVREA